MVSASKGKAGGARTNIWGATMVRDRNCCAAKHGATPEDGMWMESEGRISDGRWQDISRIGAGATAPALYLLLNSMRMQPASQPASTRGVNRKRLPLPMSGGGYCISRVGIPLTTAWLSSRLATTRTLGSAETQCAQANKRLDVAAQNRQGRSGVWQKD